MILDARNESVDLNRTDQVCIVGAGPAGITLARELADVASVLLIESGGFDFDAELEALLIGDVVGIHYPLVETRARRFGGSSQLWAGYCAMFDRHDFERRPWVPGSGWPFGSEALASYYRRAAKLLNLGTCDFDASGIMARAGLEFPFSGDELVPTVWRFGMPKQDFGKQFRAEFLESENITTLTHANVADIRLHAEHGEVEELLVRTLNGREGRVGADIFVLACGGIETPRLLLNADTQVAAGLGNSSDMVGRSFMEHPHLTVTCLELFGAGPFRGWLDREVYDGDRQFLSCAGIPHAMQEDLGLLNARGHVFRTPRMPESDVPKVGIFLEQAPNPNSRVTLVEDRDALGLRRICLDWQVTELEWKTFEQSALLLGRAFERIDAGRLIDDGDSAGRDTSRILHSNHHLGTTRMSTDTSSGVVDANCRLHDCENLYIVGGSVFPTVSWANPTLTLIALVCRLGEHLKAILDPGASTGHRPSSTPKEGDRHET